MGGIRVSQRDSLAQGQRSLHTRSSKRGNIIREHCLKVKVHFKHNGRHNNDCRMWTRPFLAIVNDTQVLAGLSE